MKSFYSVALALLGYMFGDKRISQYFLNFVYIHVET